MAQYGEAELKAALTRGEGGVYVLFGEEDYLIRHYRSKFTSPYLNGERGELDFVNIDYKSAEDAELIFGAAMSLAMITASPSIGGRRLIEIAVGSMDELGGDDVNALIEALSAASSYEENTVIMCLYRGSFDYGSLPKKPSALYKKLSSADGIRLIYFPYSTPAQLRKWIEKHFIREGLSFDHDTADLLIGLSGRRMTALSFEIRKLTSYVKARGGNRVTASDIKEVCCPGSEPDAFRLSNAILDGRRQEALAALDECRARRDDPLMVFGGISRVMTELLAVKAQLELGASPREIASRLGIHEYTAKLYVKSASVRSMEFLEDAVIACAETDLQLKSTRLGYTALKRLIISAGRGAGA